METLVKPVVRLWDWVEKVGGFPGQVFFMCTIVIVILGVCTWFGNKR
jgi:hypothetical protein